MWRYAAVAICLLYLGVLHSQALPSSTTQGYSNNPVIQRFRHYIKMNTSQPNPNYRTVPACVLKSGTQHCPSSNTTTAPPTTTTSPTSKSSPTTFPPSTSSPTTAPSTAKDYSNNAAIQLFQRYIRIDTRQPNPNLTEAVDFFKEQAAELGLPVRVLEFRPGKPIVLITWQGSDPSLPSIMLNSHMDVVPVTESEWIHPPFSADIDEDGNIFGRGTQDMKSVATWVLEAVRKLKADNVTLQRTIHITAVPDEEIGGEEGMKLFTESEEFKKLNIGFALDEGQAHFDSKFAVLYGDRTPWQIMVNCTGDGGHASIMKDNSAGEKMRRILNSFLDYRESQRAITTADPTRDLASVNGINLTGLSGGIGVNVLPTSLTATFDMRLAPDTNQTAFNLTVSQWLKDANCSHTYIRYEKVSPLTKLDDSNIYWVAFKKAADHFGWKLDPIITRGATDSRYLRHLVPALGFAPMTNIPIRAHDINEFIPAKMYLQGIDIFYNLIQAVANA